MLKTKSLAACISLIVTSLPAVVSASPAPGGFLEEVGAASSRPTLDSRAIQDFIPERGPFTFPAPYNTQAVRLTNGSDCANNDCVNYAGYSYWRNMNNHVGMESMLIFLGLDRSRGGQGPSLFELNKSSGEVRDLGALFPSNSPFSWASGEGWYFSATMPTKLYINDGPRIVRFDVITEQMQTVADISDELGQGYYVSQMHSSDDDRVHSATVRDYQQYKMQGCMAYEEDTQRYHYYPIARDFDECQIDRSGKWLLIKANLDGNYGEDNLIINLQTGQERVLLDQDGAAGHSDLGHGYMIAADNWANEANSWKLWDFNQTTLQGQRVYHNSDWTVSAPNHVSHTNSRPGVAPQDQYACGSSVSGRVSSHANEIICFNLDGSESALVVAPVMTDLNAAGGGDSYAKAPKGNLDVTGRYFLWTSNIGSARLDAFIVRVPDHLLTGRFDDDVVTDETPSDPAIEVPDPVTEPDPVVDPDPVTELDPETDPDPVTAHPGDIQDGTVDSSIHWYDTRNVAVEGASMTKTSGCDGCADAGAISALSITQDKASFNFSTDASGPLVSAGLTGLQTLPGGSGLDFSIRLQQGIAEIRERGVYRADTRFVAGDRFSISVDNGKILYARNGTVFYTSTTTAQYPLFAGVAFSSIDAKLTDLQLVHSETSANTGTEIPDATTESPEPDVKEPLLSIDEIPGSSILWFDTRNVQLAGDAVTKSSGCDGCADAGAVSLQSVLHGRASFDFTVDSFDQLMSAGLTGQQSIAGSKGLAFSLRLQQGIAEVRERGAYRADTRFAVGDRFSIVVDGGKVSYLRNGTVFHTSKTRAVYPLFAGLTFSNTGAKVKDLQFVVDESPQMSEMTVYQTGLGELEINWNTDQPAESTMQYGTSAQMGTFTEHNVALSTNHQVELIDLTPGETYHLQVLNRDDDGHISSSDAIIVDVPL